MRPDFAEVHNNLGNAAEQQGQLDEAAAHYEQAVALKPGISVRHTTTWATSSKAGQARPGRGPLSTSDRSAGPTMPRPTTTWATCWETGQARRGGRPYEQAVALRPRLAEAHNNLGNVSASRASSTRPWPGTSKPSLSGPTLAEAHNNLGNILREQGKFDEAATQYERALALKPDLVEAHNNLGSVWKQGKLDQAVTQLSKRSPSSPILPTRTTTWATR